jgi:hypothetical protein
MVRLNGDLIPGSSGQAHLGVNGGVGDAFDITTLTPFGHIHMNSGVWHDPMTGQSGVLRFSQAAGAMQVSVDGGRTFTNLVTSAGTVTSVGVLGGANLTGDVDVATRASGFLAITDSTGASPLFFAVDNLGLSGLWRFPTQGFNGSVVNELTDFNGTKVQGSVAVVGASGVVVDIVGQTMTITMGNGVVRAFAQTFGAAVTWTVTHNLGTSDVMVDVYDANSPRNAIIPDSVAITDSNTVTIGFNVAQAGRVMITGF